MAQHTDTLRLDVTSVAPDDGGGFQLQVFVNDTELTAPAAGLGMDPYDILVPTNRLVATEDPQVVTIARCSCGEVGCGRADVVIVRDGDLVHWDWTVRLPTGTRNRFPAGHYDAEIARVSADLGWETPGRVAGRLVLTGVDRDRLATHGLTVSWVYDGDPDLFRVALQHGDDYQIFIDTPWPGADPQALAAKVCEILATDPGRWRATWHPIRPAITEPPPFARNSWRRFH